jgi:EAL domain-containing protein (putative c-di-GMP-specific phosphodiesterase class I)
MTSGDSPTGSAPARAGDVDRILGAARALIGLDVAWVSRFENGEQVFTHVARASAGSGPRVGSTGGLDGSYCGRVLDGRLPAIISDVRDEPEAAALDVTHDLAIGAYAGAPIRRADGSVRGMLCVTHTTAAPHLEEREQRLLGMLAQIIGALLDEDEAKTEARQARIQRAIDGTGRRHVLQPIVDVHTGRAVGAEALARFDDPPHRPDLWFADADAVGLLLGLEVAAARTALTSLTSWPGYLSINLAPSSVLGGALDDLLADVDASSLIVELTEHAAVTDYAALHACLEPHRAAGMRLAIDDAGAGYASFQHILQLRPDYIKMDMSLVRDIHLDPVRQALASSLLTFGQAAGATVIAEGVETQDELDTLVRLGVHLVQGYLLGRPTDTPEIEGFIRPSRHVLLSGGRDLSVVLAEALRHNGDLEALTRPLLDAVLATTGLESSYLNLLNAGGSAELRFVRNAGSLNFTEGTRVNWEKTPCAALQRKQLLWTNGSELDLADTPFAADHKLRTYISLPLNDSNGTLLGTLCAASTAAVHVPEATVAQLQLVAHVLATELSRL